MKTGKKRVIGLLLMCCMFMLMPMGVFAKPKTSVSIMTVGKRKVESVYRVKSSNRKVIDIKKQGKSYRIIPKRGGEAVLSCYKGNKLKKEVYVLVADRDTFKYDASKLTLERGKSKRCRFRGDKKCKVKFSTSNKKVAVVSSDGNICAVKKGKATIYVKIYYKGKKVKTYKKPVVVTSKKTSTSSGRKEKLVSVKCSMSPNIIAQGGQMQENWFKVEATYKKGNKTYTKVIPESDYSVSGFSSSELGTHTAYIHFKGKKYPVKYKVLGARGGHIRTNVYYDCPKERPYILMDEEIDPSRLHVVREYADGSKEEIGYIWYTLLGVPYAGQMADIEVRYNDAPAGAKPKYKTAAASVRICIPEMNIASRASFSQTTIGVGEDITKYLNVYADKIDGRKNVKLQPYYPEEQLSQDEATCYRYYVKWDTIPMDQTWDGTNGYETGYCINVPGEYYIKVLVDGINDPFKDASMEIALKITVK